MCGRTESGSSFRNEFASSLAASFATVALGGLLAAGLQGWFGVSDLWFLVVWFVPAALMAAALAAFGLRRLADRSLPFRFLVGLASGAALGFAWTWCVARLVLGPWWGAVSLPALMCWMAGGASGVAGGLVLGPGNPARSRIASLVALACLAGGAVLTSEPLATMTSHDQALSLRFLKWTPGREPVAIESEGEEALAAAETALVRAARPTGRILVLWGRSRHGRGPAASCSILLTGPITKPVTLRQPDRSNALYLQDGDEFRVYPADVPTLDREITLAPHADGLWCSVRDAQGGTEGGPVRVEWP